MNSRLIGGEYTIDKDMDLSRIQGGTQTLYSCGRIALKTILEHALPDGSGTVLIPDHICGSVPDTVSNAGFKCLFYHIGEDFMPDADSLTVTAAKADVVLLVNYFGMIPADAMNKVINAVRSDKSDITVIMDDVQNYYGLYDEKTCDYAFTSLRKWFPVPDGAPVIRNTAGTKQSLYPETEAADIQIPLFSKYKFAGNILKNYRDVIGDEISLKLLEKGEEIIDSDAGLAAMPHTSLIMKSLDLEAIRLRRQRNAAVLHKELLRLDIPHLYSENAVPLFVPIVLKRGRDKVRKSMFESSVFCPVHWNDGWQNRFDGVSVNPLCETELSLICDQRYDEDDMLYQLEILRNECNDL